MQKAVQWGVDAFKAAGADSVKTESFSLKAPWAEGATEMSVVAPEGFKLRVVSMTWAPSLAAHRHVRVVDVGEDEGNYLLNYHAMSDTLDKVDFPQLKKHVAEAAALSFAIADAAERIGRRLNREQSAATMQESGFEEQLKGFGMWDDWDSGRRGREK